MARSIANTVQMSPSAYTALIAAEAAFSVIGWFKIPDNSAGSDFLGFFDEGGAGANLCLLQMKLSGAINFFYRNADSEAADITSAAGFDDDAWHRFFAVKRANNDYELYIDGNSEGTSSTVVDPAVAGSQLFISSANAGPANSRLGPMWCFDSALTVAQAEQVAKNDIVDGLTPKAAWRLDIAISATATEPERFGTEAYDLVPSASMAIVDDRPTDLTLEIEVETAPEGELVATGGGSVVYNSDATDIVKSTDGGKTFGTADTVTGTNFTPLYGGLAAEGDTVHILLPQSDPGGTSVTTQHRVSTDGGATWSSPTTLLEDDGLTSAQLRRVQMEMYGSLVVIAGLDKEDAAGGNTWFFRSQDGGVTWDNGVDIAIAEAQAIAIDRVTGNIYIVGHDTQDSGVIKVIRSTDGGDTFGSPVTLSGTTSGARPRCYAHRGYVYVVYQNETTNDDLELVRSTDDGATWESPVVVLDASAFSGVTKFEHFDMWAVGPVVHLASSELSGGPVWYRYSQDRGVTWSPVEVVAGPSSDTIWMLRADADYVYWTTEQLILGRRTAPAAIIAAGSLFDFPAPTLDGAAVQVGDGAIAPRNLYFASGEYATPFWVRPDGVNARTQRIDALPAQLVLRCGQIEVLSAAP